MKEAEWMTSTTDALLRRLGGGVCERRLMLFACACCRRAPWLAEINELENYVRLVEQYADGDGDEEFRIRTEESCKAMVDLHYRGDSVRSCLWANLRWALYKPTRPASGFGLSAAAAFGYAARGEGHGKTTEQAEHLGQVFNAAKRAEREQQAPLVRDIFGKAFHKQIRFQRRWRTHTAVGVAQQMYDARDFAAMPILADALQDAGCEDEQVLAHCRGDGPHVRGCWVVDGVLSKG